MLFPYVQIDTVYLNNFTHRAQAIPISFPLTAVLLWLWICNGWDPPESHTHRNRTHPMHGASYIANIISVRGRPSEEQVSKTCQFKL